MAFSEFYACTSRVSDKIKMTDIDSEDKEAELSEPFIKADLEDERLEHIARIRVILTANISGYTAPVDLRSYLRYIHYRQAPGPECAERAPCRIAVEFEDSWIYKDNEPAEKSEQVIFTGELYHSRGTEKNCTPFSGYRLPEEGIKQVFSHFKSYLESVRDAGWNITGVERLFRDKKNELSKIPYSGMFFVSDKDLFFSYEEEAFLRKVLIFETWLKSVK